MPWSPERDPPSMRNLAPQVRAKAIATADALLDEGLSSRIAITKAKVLAERPAKPIEWSDGSRR